MSSACPLFLLNLSSICHDALVLGAGRARATLGDLTTALVKAGMRKGNAKTLMIMRNVSEKT